MRGLQLRRQTLLRGLHQRAVEWRAHCEQHRSARPAALASSIARFTAPAWPAITTWSGAFKFAAVTISPCAALCQNLVQPAGRQLEQRRHRALSRRNGFLHVAAALAHQTHRIGKSQTIQPPPAPNILPGCGPLRNPAGCRPHAAR